MIKIAYIINSIRKNGPTNVLINMLKGLDYSRYKPTVITLIDEDDEKMIEDIRKQAISVIQLKMGKNFVTMFKTSLLRKIVDENEFDIIHTHSHIPTIMAQNLNVKKITTVHCRLKEDFCDTYGKIKGNIINLFYITALKKYNKVVSCSKSTNDIVCKKIMNSTYIRNGIDFSHEKNTHEIRKNLNIPNDAIVYMYAGILNNRKNVIKMLETFSNNLKENEYLIILGSGILEEQVKKYESKNIKILGFKNNVADYMNISNVYVSFSLSEGFPISVIEALSQNMLLLLSDIPSHKEFFTMDKSKYIGEYFNENNFLEKLSKIRKKINSKVLSRYMQQKYLSSSAMMKEYEKEYNSIL